MPFALAFAAALASAWRFTRSAYVVKYWRIRAESGQEVDELFDGQSRVPNQATQQAAIQLTMIGDG